MPNPQQVLLILVLGFTCSVAPIVSSGEHAPDYGIGHMATDDEIQPWNIDIAPDGAGLPAGKGSVEQGRVIYADKCARCHGSTGTEGPADKLVGGHNSLRTSKPIKTIGSYWPYATTLFDYLNRAMPFDAPQSLTPDEIYALTAWLLHQNGIVPQHVVLDARSLPLIEMPNRHGFIADPRPDIR